MIITLTNSSGFTVTSDTTVITLNPTTVAINSNVPNPDEGTGYLYSDGVDYSFNVPAGSGDVIAPATNTDGYLAQWNGNNSKTLKDGIPTSTFALSGHNHSGVYEPVKGADDNYVTDAEKIKLSNLSGTNTGDQDLSGYSLTSHNHTGVYAPVSHTHSDYIKKDGSEDFGGVVGYSGLFTISLDTDIPSKKYVDDAITAGGGYTDEMAQDAVGTILTDTTTIDFTYTDGTPSITADVKSSSITESLLNLSDVTTLNSSTSKHGFLPKLDNNASNFLNGQGSWAAPTASVAWGGITGTLSNQTDLQTALNGKENYHGIESLGAFSFNDTSHVLTIAATTNKYWFNGVAYSTTSAITCDIDSFETLANNTLYYFYFDDLTGTLKCSATAWDLLTVVPACALFWNGTNGFIYNEKHGYKRDLEWHKWAHTTVGARYLSGLTMTYPSTSVDGSLQIESGSIADEDIVITIAQQTTARGFYKVSANVYTVTNFDLPFVGTTGQPQYLDTDTYTLANVASNEYACYWYYATDDTSRAIYIYPTHSATAYTTLAGARAEIAPNLANFNLNGEMKLLYKVIFKGDGQFEESTDYRNTSSLPSGGSASTTASAVSFTPYGNISSTTVQTAIQELDDEKAPVTSPTFQTSINGAFLTASEMVITDGSKNIVSAPVATYPSLTELSYVKGLTSAVQTQINGKAATSHTQAETTITFSDVTTGDASTSNHGYLKKLNNTATNFLDGQGNWDTVKDSDLAFTDVTTNDVSTSAHGLMPKAVNDVTKFYRSDATQAQVSSIFLPKTLGTDHTAEGIKTTQTAAEALVFGDVCYINSSSKMAKADADAIATAGALFLAIASINQDADGLFLVEGIARDDSWAWTAGDLIYLSTTAGALVASASMPSATDDVDFPIAVARDADTIFFGLRVGAVEHT